MTKTTTIHVEPLDDGYVVTIDGKRKAMQWDKLRESLMEAILSLSLEGTQKGNDCQLTISLETDIPRQV